VKSITKLIEQLLERGEIALVVTKVSRPGSIGSKLLIQKDGDSAGSLGDALLD